MDLKVYPPCRSGPALCRSYQIEEEVRVGIEINVIRISSFDGGREHNHTNTMGMVAIGDAKKCF